MTIYRIYHMLCGVIRHFTQLIQKSMSFILSEYVTLVRNFGPHFVESPLVHHLVATFVQFLYS